MFQIKEIKDKKEWEEFLEKSSSFYPYFQSWDWGEAERSLHREVLRIGFYSRDKKQLQAVSQIIVVKAKRATFLHIRHGPVFKSLSKEHLAMLFDYFRSFAKEKNASFVRISPLIEKKQENIELLQPFKLLDAPIHKMDAEICWVLDISKSEEDLLKGMRKTHRYLIKKGLSMNIKIIRTENISDMNTFLSIYQSLSKRKHFVPHKGLKEEFEQFVRQKNACLLLASYDNKIIAGAVIVFVSNMAIYRHGASLEEYKHIPASYLLQWEAIKDAKERGKNIYNFWGIAPENNMNHPWKGLTLFKTGFGGYRKEFIHAQDLPINVWYWKNYAIEFARKMIRGY